MKVAELVSVLSMLPPDMDVMITSGRGLCWIDTVDKVNRMRMTATGSADYPYVIPGTGPFVHSPARVDLVGRTLWWHDDPRYRLRGRWPSKVQPLPKRLERIENELTLGVLAGR